MLPASCDPFPPEDPRVWYHLILTTYGAWVPGDERGFRTRHHREHVEGDYHNPPPLERYAERRERSRAELKTPPITIPAELRETVGRALLEKLLELGAFVLCIAVAGQHAHIQVKILPGTAKKLAGVAKKNAWFALRKQGWQPTLWGKGCRPVRIKNRVHQVRVYRYILGHVKVGAWVWKWTRTPRS